MLDELTKALERAETGAPEQSVESAIMIYLAAKAQAEQYEAIMANAKSLIWDVMTETSKTKYNTQCGTAAVSAAGKSISYDATALDMLCKSMPDLADVLEPHRKVIERPGTMRITSLRLGAK